MANSYQTATVLRIRVNGAEIEFLGKPKFRLGGFKREGIEADHRAGYFSKSAVPGMVEFDQAHTVNASIPALDDLEDATVSLELDTGASLVWSNMRSVEPAEGGEGKLTRKFEGPAGEEHS